MAGTKTGGAKAAQTNKERYGTNFYKVIGATGGTKSNNGGFGSSLVGKDGLTGRQRASTAGAKGGAISRKTKTNV